MAVESHEAPSSSSFARGLWAVPDREPSPAHRAAQAVRDVCMRHGLDGARLRSVLRERRDLDPAVAFVFDASCPPPDRSQLLDLVETVEERLDLAEPIPHGLRSKTRVLASGVRNVVAALVAGVSGWIVIGGIITESNALAGGTSAQFTLAVLGVALLALGLLEAAHIGAVALSTADVGALEESHPRVFRLHRYIDSKAKLEEYLSARQLGVVLIVFVIAEVTRTADLKTMPGTASPIPPALAPLLHVGAPGALLVLILGQVAPQVVTARRPAALMNLAPMAAAFHVTRFIGYLGLARPAKWLVSWWRKPERIPTAARERYVATAIDVDGVAALSTVRDIRVQAGSTATTTETTVEVHSEERRSLVVESASFPRSPAQMRVDAFVLRDGDWNRADVDEWDERRSGAFQGITLRSEVAPRLGWFEKGDVLDITTFAVLNEQLSWDYVVVDQPTKLVVMRATIDCLQRAVPHASLTVTAPAGATIERRPVTPDVDTKTGSVTFSADVSYPPVGSTIVLRWDGEEGV